MTRVLWHEMRRGEAGKAAALCAVAGLWYLLSGDPQTNDWAGWWNQTSLVVHVFGVIVMGSLMAAAAAWSASRAQRTRAHLWADTTPRGGWSQALLVGAAAWLWALLVTALLAAVAFHRTAQISEVTRPAWTPLLLTLAVIGVQIAVGVAAGTLLPSRIIAPAVGAFWYLVFLLTAFAPDLPLVRLLPAIDSHWDVAHQPNTVRLLLATAWCAAAALAVLALPALARRTAPAPGPLVAVPVAVAVLAAGTLLFLRPAPHSFWAVPAPQPAEPVCVTEGRTETCLWPDNRHLLPQARTATRTVDEALGDLPGFRRAFHEVGLAPRGTGSAELPLARPAVDARTLTESLLVAALPQPPQGCGPHLLDEAGGMPDAYLLEAAVQSRAKMPPAYYGEDFGAALGRVLEAPAANRDRWLGAAAHAVGSCRPVPPLPR
ncbi:hypothetical protein [Streptomyces sp. NPDC002490]|uniref:hypothetical protein n=1 Tax=Streptomyces sp. NPDC002490 TaxID=3154416 RepID=UPI0033215E6B